MNVHIHSTIPKRTPPEPHRLRTTRSLRFEETPHSAYLDRWIVRQASRYNDLLKTIEAAPRRSLEKVRPKSGS